MMESPDDKRSLSPQEELRRSEEKFRGLFENARDGIVMLDENGFFECNQATLRLFGCASKDQFLATHPTDWSPANQPDGRDSHLAAREYNEACCRGGAQFFEWLHQRRDGSLFFAEVSLNRLEFEGRTVIQASVRDITERKRAEEALRASEERFQKAMEHAVIGMALVAPDGRFMEVNRALCDLLGFTAEELRGRMFQDVTHPDDLENSMARVRRMLTGEIQHFQMEKRCLHKRGHILWTLVSSSLVRDGQGRPVHFITQIQDVTERKAAEHRIADALHFSRTILEMSPIGIIAYKANGEVFTANEAAARLVGCTVEELKTLNFRRLESWEHSGMLAAAEAALATGKEQRIETHLVSTFGKKIWMVARFISFLYDGETHLLGLFTDASERKRAEEEHQHLATVIEQAAETVVITDPDGVILYVNPAFEKISGYLRAEVIGKNARILQSGQHDKAFYQEMWSVLKRGETWLGHFINKRKDGLLYEEEASISPVRDPSGKVVSYVAVKRDVTREVALQRQLVQAQKMETVGRLAGGVAHDFNNLLMVIGGYSSLLLKRLPAEDPHRRMIEEIRQTVERGTSLTRQMLFFSHKQVVQSQSFDLKEAIVGMERMMEQMVGEGIQFITRYETRPLWVVADPTHIQQVLMNLAANARDAMPHGGRLTLQTVGMDLPTPDPDRYPGVACGRYAMIQVSDSGCGMSAEVQAHLFEPFFTTKERGKGTGLGLSTIYAIVKQAGGHILVQSGVGQGTCFSILLPLTAQKSDPRVKSSADEESGLGGTETILLVEDEKPVREMIHLLLESNGYQVLEAACGEEALDCFREHGKEIHLMLSDVVMPGINGLELARKLVRVRPRLKVILMSGYSEMHIMRNMMADERLIFLPKPIVPDLLLRKLREAFD